MADVKQPDIDCFLHLFPGTDVTKHKIVLQIVASF